MKQRTIANDVYAIGAVDWDRRLFDSLIPLPDGTSYNSYLIKGSDKTALLDTVDPTITHVLMEQLEEVPEVDYLIAHHAEQDHSGSIPTVLKKYKNAKVVCTAKCKDMLSDHLRVPAERVMTTANGETLSLGDRTLQFVHTPWVHWPETMCTYLKEEKILFSCDFFGSHLAASDICVTDEGRVYEAAKRYYAEIMMPFRAAIKGNLEKIKNLDIKTIAPSHGPVYDRPEFITDAYKDWVLGEPKNTAVIAYVSMHASTALLVERLVKTLAEKGVAVQQFNLAGSDIGKLAMSLVDAATIVIGTPTVLAGPHPLAAYAAYLANALRPKAKFVSIIGSMGWGGRTVENLAAMIPNLKVEVLPPVLCKGLPREEDLAKIDELAWAIARKHRESRLISEAGTRQTAAAG